jgi:hypothetical protein
MYPEGAADVVGYWAEASIFGGVWCLTGERAEVRYEKQRDQEHQLRKDSLILETAVERSHPPPTRPTYALPAS